MMFIENSCNDFIKKLSSSDHVPGGGSASALVGALGLALGSMVCNLTLGKKKYEIVEKDITKLLSQISSLRDELMQLVEDDAKLFEPLAQAYRLPKETKEQEDHRENVMEEALTMACGVPIKIMERCASAIEILDELSRKGAKLVLSDVGVGVLLCKAALQGAGLNVLINTKYMKDREIANRLNQQAARLLDIAVQRADQVFSQVEREIR